MIGGAGGQVADVRGEKNASDIGGMGHELTYRQDGCSVATLDHTPNVDIALLSILDTSRQSSALREKGRLTALFPAHTILPSLATVTLATLTSSSGISW